jgi:hypothetical protein
VLPLASNNGFKEDDLVFVMHKFEIGYEIRTAAPYLAESL